MSDFFFPQLVSILDASCIALFTATLGWKLVKDAMLMFI